MKSFCLPVAVFACMLFPTFSLAQSDTTQEFPVPPAPSVWLPAPASDALTTSTAPKPCNCAPRAYLFRLKPKRPLTPRDVQIREAVQALGVDNHRFVRSRLKDARNLSAALLPSPRRISSFPRASGTAGESRIRNYRTHQSQPLRSASTWRTV